MLIDGRGHDLGRTDHEMDRQQSHLLDQKRARWLEAGFPKSIE
jgi:hypothetical protein